VAALISLQALMSAPEPGVATASPGRDILSRLSTLSTPSAFADDPQDAVVAKQYKSDIAQFNSTAKYWTETYAIPKGDEDTSVKKLQEMGFTDEQCRAALKANDGDENRALDMLLSGL